MYIARQPIFNQDMSVYGYELLYRSDIHATCYDSASSVSATAVVMGGLYENGTEHIVGKSKAFVNFDYEFIMSDQIELIDPKSLVIEILEDVEINQEITNRILYLKENGYKIALDDFSRNENTSKVDALADIIKFDIIKTPLDSLEKEVWEAYKTNKVILAEKIETESEFCQAKRMGFQLFQGYFFSRPCIVETSISSHNRKTSISVYVQILNELNKSNFSYDNLVKIFETDINISYKVMRIVGRRKTDSSFRSLKNVLIRMGKKEIERWISVLMLQEFTRDRPNELFKISLIRSKFSEYIARKSKYSKDRDEISLMCLFSLVDVIINKPMAEAIVAIPFSKDVVDCLVHRKGKYRDVYLFIDAYEKGSWDDVVKFSQVIELENCEISKGYMQAIQWAKEIDEINKCYI